MRRVALIILFFCSAVRSSAGPSGGVRENTLLRLLALVGRAGNSVFAAAMAAEVCGGDVVKERALGNPVVLPVLLVVLLSKGD